MTAKIEIEIETEIEIEIEIDVDTEIDRHRDRLRAANEKLSFTRKKLYNLTLSKGQRPTNFPKL